MTGLTEDLNLNIIGSQTLRAAQCCVFAQRDWIGGETKTPIQMWKCVSWVDALSVSVPLQQLSPTASIQDAQKWLLKNRFNSYTRLFSHFSGTHTPTVKRTVML